MGLLTVVTAVIFAMGATGLGTAIDSAIRATICRIVGGSCTADTSASHVPTSQCETQSDSREVSADLVLFSVDVGGTGKLTLSRSVDKDGKAHWYVQQEGEVRAGADFMIGEKANLGDLGEGVSGEVKAFLKGGGGAKMEFATEKDAREFMTAAEHEPIKQTVTGWDPTGFLHWAADKVDGHHYDPPKPTEYFFEGGVKAEGSLDAKGGVGSAGVKAGVSGVAGVKFKPNSDGTSNKTVYLKLTAEAAGKLGLADVIQGEAGEKGDVMVSIEYDGQGKPKTAALELAGTVKGQVGPPAAELTGSKTIASIAGMTAKGPLKNGMNVGGSLSEKVNFTVDLTKGNNLNTVADALHSIGVPVLQDSGSRSTPNPIDGIKGLYGLYDSGADGTYLTVRKYTSTSGGDTLGIKGGDVLTFGVEGGFKFENSTIDSGSYWDPNQGMVQWAACSQ